MMDSVRFEDRLEGETNFNSWKARVMNLLEENDLDGYVTSVVAEPLDDVGKTTYKSNQAKEKKVIFDSVKYHFIPVITPLNTSKECFDTLVKIYEMKTPSQKRTWKNKLRTLKERKRKEVSLPEEQMQKVQGKIKDS